MSKEILMRFAKGSPIEPTYVCCYEIDIVTRRLEIHSCSIVSGLEHSLFVRIVNTKEDLTIKATDEELRKAIALYYEFKNEKS